MFQLVLAFLFCTQALTGPTTGKPQAANLEVRVVTTAKPSLNEEEILIPNEQRVDDEDIPIEFLAEKVLDHKSTTAKSVEGKVFTNHAEAAKTTTHNHRDIEEQKPNKRDAIAKTTVHTPPKADKTTTKHPGKSEVTTKHTTTKHPGKSEVTTKHTTTKHPGKSDVTTKHPPKFDILLKTSTKQPVKVATHPTSKKPQ